MPHSLMIKNMGFKVGFLGSNLSADNTHVTLDQLHILSMPLFLYL